MRITTQRKIVMAGAPISQAPYRSRRRFSRIRLFGCTRSRSALHFTYHHSLRILCDPYTQALPALCNRLNALVLTK